MNEEKEEDLLYPIGHIVKNSDDPFMQLLWDFNKEAFYVNKKRDGTGLAAMMENHKKFMLRAYFTREDPSIRNAICNLIEAGKIHPHSSW